jgi:hypothetical protein
MDRVIDTNPDYAKKVLVRTGVLKDDQAQTANNSQIDPSKLSDAEIDGFLSGDTFKQLSEIVPDQAEKLKTIMESAKALRAEKSAWDTERTQLEEKAKNAKEETPEQKQAREAVQNQYKTSVDAFNTVYADEITSDVDRILSKTYGLEVSADESEKSPMMAFLKNAKKRLILAGGLEGSGDFDNDLYEWGKSRPAYTQAAQAMVKYAKAGEKDNARTAAKELKPFVELFLQDRLKSPGVEMIDQIIQMVAQSQKAALDKPLDTVPDSQVTKSAAAGRGDLLHDIDNLKV